MWLASYPVGLALFVVRLIVQSSSWLLIILSVGIALVLSIALPYLGLWGGADSKAFIFLAIVNPLAPTLSAPVLPTVDPFFPLVVFSNAYVVSIASILYPIQRNLRFSRSHGLFEGLEAESGFRKLAAFMTGYRVQIDKLETNAFLFPLESIHRKGSALDRHLKFGVSIDSDIRQELAEIKAANDSQLLRGTVWVSPGLPFLVFVTLGFALSLLLGDITWWIVSALMKSLVALA